MNVLYYMQSTTYTTNRSFELKIAWRVFYQDTSYFLPELENDEDSAIESEYTSIKNRY